MNTKTDPPAPEARSTENRNVEERKPRFAIFIATAGGLGYFPKAPGTLGSLAGVALAIAPLWTFFVFSGVYFVAKHGDAGVFVSATSGWLDPVLLTQIAITLTVAAVGVWAADRAAKFWRVEDPGRVVIDEVSGQHLTLLLGCGVPLWWKPLQAASAGDETLLGLISVTSALNWKYLLVGFILFRLFDIWKPAPARQAESLPGGWGIMADDWIAGVYAGIGLWLARAAGL
jgi:phosphatidylglycerophosphatase A